VTSAVRLWEEQIEVHLASFAVLNDLFGLNGRVFLDNELGGGFQLFGRGCYRPLGDADDADDILSLSNRGNSCASRSRPPQVSKGRGGALRISQ
jgi:hypothetical protein